MAGFFGLWIACGGRSGVSLTSDLEHGQRVVKASKELFTPGLIGPFCLETISTEDMEFIAFEISARIVVGTNLTSMALPIPTSCYHEPMSTGRRIAREIKDALREDSLERII